MPVMLVVPATQVWRRGTSLTLIAQGDSRQRLDWVTGSLTFADGTVDNILQNDPRWRSYGDYGVQITFPDPGLQVADGWATASLTINYREPGADSPTGWWYSTDYATANIWLGATPPPQIVFPGDLSWGKAATVTASFLPPGAVLQLNTDVWGMPAGSGSAVADAEGRATINFRPVNTQEGKTGYEGLILLNVNGVTKHVNIHPAFWWALQIPAGNWGPAGTVTPIETYRGYQIVFIYAAGGQIYAAKDPLGNEVNGYNTGLSGIRTLVDNDVGAYYALTLVSNMQVDLQVNDQVLHANTTTTLPDGDYRITAPAEVIIGGVPYVLTWMWNRQTAVKFTGETTILQGLYDGPETTEVHYEPSTTDALIETYKGYEIWYRYRSWETPPYALEASVGGNGRFFRDSEFNLPSVRAWIDAQATSKTPTHLALNAAEIHLAPNASASFTATLTAEGGSAISGAQITWSLDDQQVSAGTTDASGRATATITFPLEGVHVVSVEYGGSEIYGASRASASAQVSPTGGGQPSTAALVAGGVVGALIIIALLRRK